MVQHPQKTKHPTRITVVIPVKDEEINLALILPALQKQTAKPRIIVAIEPTTTDRSRAVCMKYGVEVVPGGLPGPGRNAGAALAKTPFLCFMDADVVPVHNTFLAKGMKEMERRRLDIACVHCTTQRPTFMDRVYFVIMNNVLRVTARLGQAYAGGWCIFARRRMHEDINGFDETVEFFEDTEYGTRAKKHGYRFGYMSRNNPLYVSVRRLRKDGTWKTLFLALTTTVHRIFKGEVRDIGEIDKDYFEYK